MGARGEVLVAERPERPVLVFDGDCGFCRRWVARWRGITGARVEYRPFQEAAGSYPEVGIERFRRRVWLIGTDGRAVGGAEAVLRLYGIVGEKRLLRWCYDRVPGFAGAAEAAYDAVAADRGAADRAVSWLWGDISRRPRYRRMRAVFLRALGLIYLAAFASLAVQVDGLIGDRGILPAAEYLREARLFLGPERYWKLPTLLWLEPGDRMLHLLCWGGVALSGLLVAGILPKACALLLWAFYLSLTVAGQEFLGFQWDSLLLETGLLAILFAPWGPRLDRVREEPSHAVVWLLRWLLFRLMFLSGVVKLGSGDPTWRAWEAMKYHYETQPLPTWTSWYVHQLPARFQAASVGFLFWAELVAPFFLLGPRRLRLLGFWTTAALQLLILATGNYGFFNVLSLVLCLVVLEDRDLGPPPAVEPERRPRRLAGRLVIGVVGTVVVLVTGMETLGVCWPSAPFPNGLESLRAAVAPLRSANSYGLFAVMTTERNEITVEGSDDGRAWKPYRFRWKPDEPGRRPRFTTPHLPRLDWQMWFAALSPDCRHQAWFLRFEERLLEGSPPVLRLLRENPFPGRPPRFIRARLDRYRFTTWGARDWWRRADAGGYCPPLGR